MQRFGTSYYYATLFFPKEIQEAVMQLYKLVRIPDQIVDEIQPWIEYTQHYAQAKTQLQELQITIIQAIQTHNTHHPKRGETVQLFQKYNIQISHLEDFFKAMIQDCDIHRYDSYTQLQWYMYGSAEVVWLMMCDILKAPTSSLPAARLLGEAMQYTNFLRDIYEDYTEYGRIYMPTDKLQQHNLTHDDIIHFCQTKNINPNFQAFMKEQIIHCRQLYTQANQGILLLPEFAHLPVLLASKLYEAILDKIESIQYNVFANSARTDKRQKGKVIAYQVMAHHLCPLKKYHNFTKQ
jgi:phytoene synthase